MMIAVGNQTDQKYRKSKKYITDPIRHNGSCDGYFKGRMRNIVKKENRNKDHNQDGCVGVMIIQK